MQNPFIFSAVLLLGLAIGWWVREYQFQHYPVVFRYKGEKVLEVKNGEKFEFTEYTKNFPHLVREGEEKK